MLEVLDCRLLIAKQYSDPAAENKCRSQVWAQLQSAIDEGSAIVQFAAQIGECKSPGRERNRILRAKINRSSGNLQGFRCLAFLIGHGTRGFSADVAQGHHSAGR